jgi:hypothetical protein
MLSEDELAGSTSHKEEVDGIISNGVELHHFC